MIENVDLLRWEQTNRWVLAPPLRLDLELFDVRLGSLSLRRTPSCLLHLSKVDMFPQCSIEHREATQGSRSGKYLRNSYKVGSQLTRNQVCVFSKDHYTGIRCGSELCVS